MMRAVSDGASVRLYHLDEANTAAHTLFYGPLVDALAIARQQPEAMQAALWLATESDVVAYLDIEGG